MNKFHWTTVVQRLKWHSDLFPKIPFECMRCSWFSPNFLCPVWRGRLIENHCVAWYSGEIECKRSSYISDTLDKDKFRPRNVQVLSRLQEIFLVSSDWTLKSRALAPFFWKSREKWCHPGKAEERHKYDLGFAWDFRVFKYLNPNISRELVDTEIRVVEGV